MPLWICGWATLVLKISVYHAAACTQTDMFVTKLSRLGQTMTETAAHMSRMLTTAETRYHVP